MAPTATAPVIPPTAPTPSSSSSIPAPSSLEEANARYASTKSALRTGLTNKRTIDRALVDLESQIYLFEGSYLSTTATSGGNIVKGFDGYLKNSSTSGGGRSSSSQNVLAEVGVEDRIFSMSSATWQKSLEIKANEGNVEEPEREATPPLGSAKKNKEGEKEKTKKKDKEKTKENKERSETPNLKSSKDATGGGSAGGTPTKQSTGGKAGAGKLKRKNAEGADATSTPTAAGVKVGKKKKDDD